jgi:hypothetical protein
MGAWSGNIPVKTLKYHGSGFFHVGEESNISKRTSFIFRGNDFCFLSNYQRFTLVVSTVMLLLVLGNDIILCIDIFPIFPILYLVFDIYYWYTKTNYWFV